MKKLGKSTYDWEPSLFSVILILLVWGVSMWYELLYLAQWGKGFSDLGTVVALVLFILYETLIKPFIIIECIGYFLYIYVKLTSKYEEPR